ncbi:T9SS type A sorting domain-containing protein [Flavobacterium sp. LaA7.5]|nr:T9SS type A sorting domain-containing protein [Flavobacterium salilacus subsp. altitudinum]
MKNFIIAAITLFAITSQAQDITVTGKDGIVITDGYTYSTNSLDTESGEGGYMPIQVTNNTAEDIYVKLKMDSFENASGNENFIFFCFGEQCYFSVSEGSTVPEDINAAKISAGSHNPNADHFANAYAGDVAEQDVIYNMSLVQYNPDGTEGDVIMSFSFRYTTAAGIEDVTGLNNIGITLNSTVVTDNLDIDAKNDAKLEVYDLNGKLVKNTIIKSGTQSIDFSNLSSSIYIARFTNSENKVSQVKLVKK